MAKIKIKDLPKGQKVSKEEVKKALGGINFESGLAADSTISVTKQPESGDGCGCGS